MNFGSNNVKQPADWLLTMLCNIHIVVGSTGIDFVPMCNITPRDINDSDVKLFPHPAQLRLVVLNVY